MDRSALKLIGSIAIGNALVPLNSTMIVVALPFIARDAGTDLASASWLVTTYLIAMAALQPIGGRIGDRLGRRRLMLGALAYFGIASIGATLAQGLALLVFFRLQQALAAALIVPNGMGVLRRAAGERAGMHFGLNSAVAGSAATAGPLVGGLLVALDWRLIFLVNVPIVALAIALALANVPDEAPHRETRFDVTGVVALGLILSGAAWSLTRLANGVDATTLVILVAVVIGAVVFVRYESRVADAALPPALFRIRPFAAANATIAAANTSLYATFLAIPALLATDATSALLVGTALFALSVAMAVLGPVTGMLIDRFGAKWPPAGGGLLIALGSLGSGFVIHGATLDARGLVGSGTFPFLLASLLVTGAGVSLTFPATRVAAIDAVPRRYVALASGVVSTSRYFGGMVGAIVASAALTTVAVAMRETVLFGILAAGGVVTSVAALGMPGIPHGRRETEAEVA